IVEATKRLHGLLIGLAQEIEGAEPAMQALTQEVRVELTIRQKLRQALEAAATETKAREQLQSAEDASMRDATADLARARRLRQLAENDITRQATRDLAPEAGRQDADQDRVTRARRAARLAEVDEGDIRARAAIA